MRETKAKEERGSEGSGGGARWVDELTAIGEEERDGWKNLENVKGKKESGRNELENGFKER